MIRAFEHHAPQVGSGARIDPTAVVIGRVDIGIDASIWPLAVVRGDSDQITIGPASNVQDGAVLHADAGVPCCIGARVTVGHRAIIHGCTIEDECLIGMGAIVMNHARIGAGSIVAAGAVVSEGVVVPPGSLVVGVPGRVKRPVRDDERDAIVASARHYVAMIARHGR